MEGTSANYPYFLFVQASPFSVTLDRVLTTSYSLGRNHNSEPNNMVKLCQMDSLVFDSCKNRAKRVSSFFINVYNTFFINVYNTGK